MGFFIHVYTLYNEWSNEMFTSSFFLSSEIKCQNGRILQIGFWGENILGISQLELEKEGWAKHH